MWSDQYWDNMERMIQFLPTRAALDWQIAWWILPTGLTEYWRLMLLKLHHQRHEKDHFNLSPESQYYPEADPITTSTSTRRHTREYAHLYTHIHIHTCFSIYPVSLMNIHCTSVVRFLGTSHKVQQHMTEFPGSSTGNPRIIPWGKYLTTNM